MYIIVLCLFHRMLLYVYYIGLLKRFKYSIIRRYTNIVYYYNTDLRLFNANLNTLLTIRFSLLITLQINFRSLYSNIMFNCNKLQ